MEDRDNLKEFFRVLGSAATRDILHTIREGQNQHKDFVTFGSISTINQRPKQLESLGIVKHHLTREEKRRECYTLTEKGERVMKAIIGLEKAFLGE